MKTTLTKKEYNKLKSLISESNGLNKKLNKNLERVDILIGQEDSDWSCDLIFNGLDINDFIKTNNITIVK